MFAPLRKGFLTLKHSISTLHTDNQKQTTFKQVQHEDDSALFLGWLCYCFAFATIVQPIAQYRSHHRSIRSDSSFFDFIVIG